MSQLIDSTHEALPTGTVTFLFTDIEGSTKLAQQYPEALPSLLGRHHAILHQSIQAFHGIVFKIVGDAFCAAFQTALGALDAALMAQGLFQHEAWAPAPIMVRMGIHTGAAEASVDDQGVDYTGYLTLARVQSIMSSAHGGQVLLSGASAELVRGNLPAGVMLRDMGEHRLKREAALERLWQPAADGLRGEFPPLYTLSVLPNNLPVQLNTFIGRERELAQTKELLSTTHLLTLIGPGGTGKTRLTLQLAAELLPEFAGGAWLVELAPLADPTLVLQTIAAALGLRELPGAALKDLVTDFLRTKYLLLILDNCEHLVEACAVLADHLLHTCPHLKMIASSREALGIAGETVYRVPPLALPESDSFTVESLRRSEAVQLFLERAAAIKPGFGLSEQNAPAVAKICQRLDGIPLALELAAARVGMLAPQQIAARLDDRFRLLTGGSRTALPRQQTLRSLIDWSHDLLSEAERLLFCRLAVFVGGWSLEAAEAVCPEMDVLELLAQLVQKSLVAAEEREEATRFRMLETIRQYARDRLLEAEAAQVRDRHLAYYLKFAEAGEYNFYSANRLEWIDQCELELDNFRAALQWGLEYNVVAALRLAGALTVFWPARSFTIEGRRWLQAALDQAAALPTTDGEPSRQQQAALAKALIGIGQMSYGDGDYRSGLQVTQEAVRLYRQLGDKFGLGFALCSVGNMAAFQGDMALAEQALTDGIHEAREIGNNVVLSFGYGVLSRYISLPRGDLVAARRYAEDSAQFSREAGLAWAEAQAELILASIGTLQGQWGEARTHALAALGVFRELRDPLLMNVTYTELGDIELCAGNIKEAEQYHQQSILAFRDVGQKAYVSHELESFAFIAQAKNQAERAARLLGAAEALREGLGTSVFGVERMEKEYERAVAWLHTQFDEAAYGTHWDEGCAMSLDQAISYALEP